MQLNPYLHFNGNCEEALKYYQKVLGAKIEMMMPYESGPPDMPTPDARQQGAGRAGGEVGAASCRDKPGMTKRENCRRIVGFPIRASS